MLWLSIRPESLACSDIRSLTLGAQIKVKLPPTLPDMKSAEPRGPWALSSFHLIEERTKMNWERTEDYMQCL